MKNIICFIFLVLSMSACSYDINKLKDRVHLYYKYEKNKEWSNTYKLRDDGFRRAIDMEDYAVTMAENSNNWELLEYKIQGIKIQGNIAYIKIRFLEKVPKSVTAIPTSKDNMAYFKSASVWVYENQNWYCLDAVSRGHFPLNSNLVYYER